MSTLYARKILLKEELEAIGSVAVESAALEGFVEWTICRVCGLPEHIGRLLLGNMTLGGKIASMVDLIKECVGQDEYQEIFQQLVSDISHEISNRNMVIHGLRTGPAREFKAADIQQVAERLHFLHGQLTDPVLARVLTRLGEVQSRQDDITP
jgi:hypothetical protein